jgi:hypothetical protein
MIGATVASPLAATASGPSVVTTSLAVVDDAGRPIPHATVWGYALPRLGRPAIARADLWRLARRCAESFENATAFNVVVPTLLVPRMPDASGRARIAIDFRDLDGSTHRPTERKTFGFVVMKRGYEPAGVDFVDVNEAEFSATVALGPGAAFPAGSRAYWSEFERLRWELSDTNLARGMSEETHRRIEGLRAAMEASAVTARAASDSRTAARIYARMRDLPAVLFVEGKPAGFSQRDRQSGAARDYLRAARELDAGNAYVAADFLLAQATDEFGPGKYDRRNPSADQKSRFGAFLEEMRSLVGSRGHELWPRHLLSNAMWHLRSPDPADRVRAKPLLEALYEAEPAFQEREKLLAPVMRMSQAG